MLTLDDVRFWLTTTVQLVVWVFWLSLIPIPFTLYIAPAIIVHSGIVLADLFDCAAAHHPLDEIHVPQENVVKLAAKCA